MRFLVDTNLLMQIANGACDPMFALATSSVDQLRTDGVFPAIVPQNLYEFWAFATRPEAANDLGMSKAEARQSMRGFSSFRLFQDERGVLKEWLTLIERYEISGKTTHDARLVAAMLRHDIAHLLTFNDSHFARFKKIAVLQPQAVVSGTAL